MATALKLEFDDLSRQEEPIKAGLFHLSLNLLYQPDSDTLNERKELLDIQLTEEHVTLHPILKNLIALINHRLPRRQNEVLYILENIRSEHPEHLNTLANLEVIYKELHRHNESDHCKQEKETILNRTDSEAKELKAQCVLEQAYSLTIEETTNHEGIANLKLRDTLKILSSEHERSSGERQEYLGKALRYAEQASSCVLSSMFCNRPDEKRQRKKYAIGKFLQGLNMLESMKKEKTVQYYIWNYCYGMVLNRYDFSVSQKEDDSDNHNARTELNKKVLQVFLSTICKLNVKDVGTLYNARSYAYIGHLCITRKDIVNDILKSNTLSVGEQSILKNLIRNPLECFSTALRLRPQDVHVLNRFGRSLKNKANFESSRDDEKWNLMLQAYHCLTQSIGILPHNNWFAYVTRMETSRDLALLSYQHEVREWLEEARMDGIICYNSKATDVDLCTLANVCQMLAKWPNIRRYGSHFVRDKRFIHEAIFYLNYALQLGGFVNYKVVYTLSTCLNEIEEHRAAIEWMKRAMHLARKSSKPESLTRIVHFILDLYRAKSSESLTSRNYLLSEMLFWIGQGKAKFPDISRSISDLCKYNADGMLDFITFLLNDKDSNSASNKTLISSCIDALKHWQGKRGGYEDRIKEFDDKHKILSSSVTVTPDSERTAQYTVPDIVMPFSIDAKMQHSKFKYDFFVSHSNVNRDWVNNYLLHQLETKLHDNDIAFKGCIADRDFTPGNTIIDNIIDAVKHSCKIIFVITADFITSRWCDFEVDKALIEMLNTKKKEDCIIPILLEKITDQSFPEKLGHITYLDLTDESKRFEEVMKLKRALSIQLD